MRKANDYNIGYQFISISTESSGDTLWSTAYFVKQEDFDNLCPIIRKAVEEADESESNKRRKCDPRSPTIFIEKSLTDKGGWTELKRAFEDLYKINPDIAKIEIDGPVFNN